MTGTLLSIERCSLHDGPGLRTTVFLKGCSLKCIWCHNPESNSFNPELFYFDERCTRCGECVKLCANHIIVENEHRINRKDCKLINSQAANSQVCGKCVNSCLQSAIEIKGVKMSAQDVIKIALKDEKYYKQSNGGITISGGEPLAQAEFSLELLRLAKESGLHTCLETSGYTSADHLLSVMPYVDLFLYDFKESNEEKHKNFTGVSHNSIIENLYTIDQAGAKIILRCPIIPSCNDRSDHFSAVSALANSLNNILEVNIMPYHPMGASKAKRIGREYFTSDFNFPADDQIESWIKKIRQKTNVTVKRG